MVVRWGFLPVLLVSILFITTTRAQAALVVPDASYQLGVSFQTALEPSRLLKKP